MRRKTWIAQFGLWLCCGLVPLGVCADETGRTDWPRFRGPYGSGFTHAPQPLVEHLDDATLVWVSEERRLGVARGMRISNVDAGRVPHRAAGYCGPVAANGRVYLQFFVPSGDAVDPRHETAAADRRADTWRVEADDVVLCMDAADGNTLWKAALPHGRNLGYLRNGNYQHPAIRGKRVYVQGTGGWAHALDVATGAVVWSAQVGAAGREWSERVRKAVEARDVQRVGQGYQFNVSPVVVGDVVVMNDQSGHRDGCGLVALDVETGRQRWVVSKVVGRIVTPAVWREELVIGAGPAGVTAIEAATGKVKWRVEEPCRADMTPSIDGDRLVVGNVGVRAGLHRMYRAALHGGEVPRGTSLETWLEGGRGYTAYGLHVDGPPKELWSLPLKYAGCNSSPVLRGDYGYIQTLQAGLHIVEMSSGNVLETGQRANLHISPKACGNRLFVYDRMLDISDPQQAKPAGAIKAFGGFMPSHFYDCCVMDGHLFLRGWLYDDAMRVDDEPEMGCVACYDLRKGIVREPVRAVLDSGVPEADRRDALLELAWHDKTAVRIDALRAVSAIDGIDAVRGLIRVLGAPAIDARELAVEELSRRTQDSKARALLTTALEDERPEVRARAAQVLGNVGPAAQDALPELIALMDDKHPAVNSRLGVALPSVAADTALPPECLPFLFKHMRHGAASIAFPALDAMVRVGEPACAFFLERLAVEEHRYVRLRIASALGKLGALAGDAAPVLERMTEATKDAKERRDYEAAVKTIRAAISRQAERKRAGQEQ